MRNAIALVCLVLLSGCVRPDPRVDLLQKQVAQLHQGVDSLMAVTAAKDSAIAFQEKRFAEMRVLIRFTRSRCDRYAKIVRRTPSQSVFIVGWINRAFQWVDR